MHKAWMLRLLKKAAFLLFVAAYTNAAAVSVKAEAAPEARGTKASEVAEVGGEGNAIYDRLKDRLEHEFDKGLEQIGDADAIEITGNLPERLLRSVANVLAKNLRSIKAGSLIIGVISFVLGAVLALLIRKDKKIRKRAVGIGMLAVPALLLIVVFGVSGFVSIFK